MLPCYSLCGILCLRENPCSECNANVEGKGWKKAPPCWCVALLITEGNQSTSALLWVVMQCPELWAKELLTFHFVCTFCHSLCSVCASPSVIVKCERAGRLKL